MMLAATLALAANAFLPMQDVPTVTPAEVQAAYSHGFTRVASVRELGDGRLIVLDVADATVHMIDTSWTSMLQVGRRGSGPREYIRPIVLFALPGDSSAVYDEMNSRILIIDSDGTPGGIVNPQGAAARCRDCRRSSAGVWLSYADAVDGFGNWYALALPVEVSSDGSAKIVDSVAIERWTSAAPERDTVAFMPSSIPLTARYMGGFVTWQPRERPVVFEPLSVWAVGSDGWIAIAYPDPYRVDLVEPTGAVHAGAPIPHQPVRVSEEHKRSWRERQQQSVPVMVVTRDGQRGQQMRTPDPIEPEWPDEMPPFLYAREHPADRPRPMQFAPDGTLWVERTTPAGEGRLHDVIDRRGAVVRQVRLPKSRRLVGFGNGTIYLVRIDEFDLEYLERYAIPG